ncbi:hypothetical protein F4821DRAFT_277757 [Hypoxylon rubiginosum]|uniref:Uncharacterized protein n=1 Tax=Hypoxylon rubiginosum TaxID=110542 RepID=A0ACC0D4I2_9PEZI|nr:hypothetical protein F4821DRAFT_277757 [Hypoxylon rubiginosum]
MAPRRSSQQAVDKPAPDVSKSEGKNVKTAEPRRSSRTAVKRPAADDLTPAPQPKRTKALEPTDFALVSTKNIASAGEEDYETNSSDDDETHSSDDTESFDDSSEFESDSELDESDSGEESDVEEDPDNALELKALAPEERTKRGRIKNLADLILGIDVVEPDELVDDASYEAVSKRCVQAALGLPDVSPTDSAELFLNRLPSATKVGVQNFCARLGKSKPASDIDLNGFLTSDDNNWQDHDSDLTGLWDKFVDDIMALSNGQIRKSELVKPSGPLNAELAFIWHYPTFKTSKRHYGHVLDVTNPCLKVQYDKIGPNSSG